MSEHTGGEWIAFDNAMQTETRHLAIAPASAFVPNIPLGKAEVAANMRLMAAAPKLLKAARLVIKAAGKVDWFLNGAVGKLGVYLSPSELRAIIAAIADGTGEAQDADDAA